MEPLKTKQKFNDVDYAILERSKTRYFAELFHRETHEPIAYETGRIYTTKERKAVIAGKQVNFKSTEQLMDNTNFGKDEFEKCMTLKYKNEVYSYYLQGIQKDEARIKD
jgi:hypothetical protein